MDEQRALLDSLMGFNRDGDRPDEASLDFRSSKVCKSWLCGLCPRDLFQNTRLDVGGCELLHIPHLRVAYQEHLSVGTFGYERGLANELSKLLADVEKKIARAQKRLQEDGDAAEQTQDEDPDRSLQLLEKTAELKHQQRQLLRQNGVNVADVNQKLRVCDVCGAFLSIFDSDRRLADHFGGKVHVGYVQIRSKLKELLEKEKEQPQKEKRQEKRSRSRPRSRRDEQRHTRERSRSRDRRHSRRERSRRSSSVSRDRKRSRRRGH